MPRLSPSRSQRHGPASQRSSFCWFPPRFGPMISAGFVPRAGSPKTPGWPGDHLEQRLSVQTAGIAGGVGSRRNAVREQMLVAHGPLADAGEDAAESPSFTARSIATSTPSRKSSSPACRAIMSAAIFIGPRARRASCPACCSRMATGPMAGFYDAGEKAAKRDVKAKGEGTIEAATLSAASAPGDARAHGLRRLSLRHGRRRRQQGDSTRRGVRRRRGRTAPAELHGLANLEQRFAPSISSAISARCRRRSASA